MNKLGPHTIWSPQKPKIERKKNELQKDTQYNSYCFKIHKNIINTHGGLDLYKKYF